MIRHMRAIGCQFVNATLTAFRGSETGPGGFAGRQLRRIALLVALAGAFVALAPRAGHAKIDAVDIAFDAFNLYIGLPVPPEAAGFVKEMVRCAADGKSVADCAKELVVKALVKDLATTDQDVANFAACLANGGKLGKCVDDGLMSKVPPAARPLVQCVKDGGNVAVCAQNFAISQAGGAIDMPRNRPRTRSSIG